MDNVFAAIDIGTNSVRLAVVRVETGQRLNTLASHREVVRLGEGEFETNRMTPEAIARGSLVCARFAETARGFGAAEIVALATSAVREADNREEFVDRVREEAGIEVRVISGVEEARLIWMGVSSGVELGERAALHIDIGGGSTEVIIGTAAGYRMLESLKLGSVRMSNQFFEGGDAVRALEFERVQSYVRGVASQVTRRVSDLGYDIMLGSAGTITTLGEIVARRTGETSAGRGVAIKRTDLRETVLSLSRMSLEERRGVPGMDANRAEIILGGAAILLTLMEEFGADRLSVSDRGLRDGILLDHLLREEGSRENFQALSVRRRSILQLARACNYEAEHAAHTAFLAIRLFDEMNRLGAHTYGEAERELLDYASIVHDIGAFLSHSNHQKHAYYLIRNYDLLGFNDTEIDIIANVALYHRKGIPKKRHENLAALGRGDRRRVSVLAAFLRVAEGLDRSHLGLVKDVCVTLSVVPYGYTITLISEADCQLEIWGVQNNRDLFDYVFNGEAPLEAHTVRD